MRALTEIEQAERDRRRLQFEAIQEEIKPVLIDFVECLELPNAPLVTVDANAFLPAISQFMEDQEVGPDDRGWIIARISYFVGERLVQKYGGCWYLNEMPDTRYFLHYVVGKFSGIRNPQAMIDPFFLAAEYVDSPRPRSLVNLLAEVDAELESIGS